jgi:hypothetical protein
MTKLKTIALLAMLASLVACNFPGSQAAVPTQDIALTLDAARTQAALTVEAEIASRATATSAPTATLAATATELPTATLAPSFPPADTLPPAPTATNTFIPATSTPAYTATPSDYNCTVTSASPAPNTEFDPRADFDGKWKVKNTGSKDWSASDIDYKYVSGEKTYKNEKAYDFTQDVESGDSIDIIIDMLAPDTAGTYKTSWAVTRSGNVLCYLNLTIVVK